MRYRLLFSLLLFCALFIGNVNILSAQEANFDLARQFTRQKMDKMVGSNGLYPHWIENTNKFWYSYTTSDGIFWYMVNAEEGTKQKLFNRQKMAARLTKIFNKPFNYQDLALHDFQYNAGKGGFTFHAEGFNFKYEYSTHSLIKMDSVKQEPPARWKSFSPDSTWIAFARNHNLYLMKTNDGDSTVYQLTTGGERWYSFQADPGDTTSSERLRAAVTWFKDSEKFYVYRRDLREVKELWVINALGDRPTLKTYKYAMPGEEDIGETEIWVFKADTLSRTDGVLIQTETEKWADEAIMDIEISKDSDYMWLLRRNRLYTKIDVLKANTTTGEVEVLWSEEFQPYFNPRFIELYVINDGEQYIWWSDRTGWGQLYRYDSEGNLINRITEGFYTAGNIVKIDTSAQTIYFMGYGREKGVNPYYAMLYKIQFDGSGMQRLTPENATHQIFMAEDANYFVDNYSRVNLPTVSVLRNGDGELILKLEEMDVSQLKKAGWEPPSMFTVKAADGVTDLYGVMWKPFNFDSTKTYPIIAWVYPGPQTVPFPVAFEAKAGYEPHMSNAALAQLGFIVVSFGTRGSSPLRSRNFHTYGYGNLRDYALGDLRYGLEQLAARYNFINIDKVGIYGHSGGGFMSTAAILTYPDFFDVAVSASGNHDNNIYNYRWSEMHHGVKKITKTIDANPSKPGRQDSTVVKFKAPVETNMELAENLEGHLLLVTGAVDSNVHPANTIRMANALIKAGKRFDYLVMPGQSHHFGPYKDYYTRVVWHYFAKYLLGDYPDDVEYTLPEYDIE